MLQSRDIVSTKNGHTDGQTKKWPPLLIFFFFFFFFLGFCTITYASRQVFLYLFHKYDAKLGDSNADLFFITEFNMNWIRIRIEFDIKLLILGDPSASPRKGLYEKCYNYLCSSPMTDVITESSSWDNYLSNRCKRYVPVLRYPSPTSRRPERQTSKGPILKVL
jgi:hypothetical protein